VQFVDPDAHARAGAGLGRIEPRDRVAERKRGPHDAVRVDDDVMRRQRRSRGTHAVSAARQREFAHARRAQVVGGRDPRDLVDACERDPQVAGAVLGLMEGTGEVGGEGEALDGPLFTDNALHALGVPQAAGDEDPGAPNPPGAFNTPDAAGHRPTQGRTCTTAG
jgi:hypothetical protein